MLPSKLKVEKINSALHRFKINILIGYSVFTLFNNIKNKITNLISFKHTQRYNKGQLKKSCTKLTYMYSWLVLLVKEHRNTHPYKNLKNVSWLINSTSITSSPLFNIKYGQWSDNGAAPAGRERYTLPTIVRRNH